LVKWYGYPLNEVTWEPLRHMNENCRELIAKARALFAWRRPGASMNAGTNNAGAVPHKQIAEADRTVEPAASNGDVNKLASQEASVPPSGKRLDVTNANPENNWQSISRDTSAQEPVPPPAGHAEASQVISSLTIPDPLPQHNVVDVVDDDNLVESTQKNQLETNSMTSGKSNRRWEPLSTEAAQSKRPRLRASLSAPEIGSVPSDSAKSALLKRRSGLNGSVLETTNGTSELSTPPPRPSVPPPHQSSSAQTRSSNAVKRLSREGEVKSTVRDIRCICGTTEKLSSTDKGPHVICRMCHSALHASCVQKALGKPIPAQYTCPLCRLEHVDDFYPLIGPGLLRHSYASSSSTVSLSFVAQASQWKLQQWAVHLRSVAVNSATLGGPTWPYRVQGKLNGRPCVAIDPPRHLHIRREQCYNLTSLLRQGVNSLELRFTSASDAKEDQVDLCVGVVLTRPRSVSSIISRVQTRSASSLESGRQRVEHLITQVAALENEEGECKVTGNFGRKLRPLCPVSHCPIQLAAIGRSCNHVQVFDLHAYIAVNQRMRSLDKRWQCPVCSLPLRPDDIMLEPFAQSILDSISNEIDTIEAVVFKEDCSWSIITALKDEKESEQSPKAHDRAGDGHHDSKNIVELSDSD